MSRLSLALFLILCVLLFSLPVAAEGEVLNCGVASGYPPYQFQDEQGQPVGLDVDIMNAVARHMGREVRFYQDEWDNVVSALRLDRLDCISGMEITFDREKVFDFTTPYYRRQNVVFAQESNNAINNLEDLRWKVIAGDRHSYVERQLSSMGLKRQIRIRQAGSKDESMELLRKREVVAIIAPREVGYYLAVKHGLKVKVVNESDPGSPVGISVNEGNDELLAQIQAALSAVEDSGELGRILGKWQK